MNWNEGNAASPSYLPSICAIPLSWYWICGCQRRRCARRDGERPVEPSDPRVPEVRVAGDVGEAKPDRGPVGDGGEDPRPTCASAQRRRGCQEQRTMHFMTLP